MKKSILLITLSLLLAAVCVVPALANEPSLTVNIRIEGKDKTLFCDDVSTNNELNYGVLNMIMLADTKSDELVIEGLKYGYITAINGVKIGQSSSGSDSYNVRINGKYVPFSELPSYSLKNGDKILIYYGDEFGKGMMVPIIDTKKIDQGYIKLTCEVPTEDGSAVVTENIVGATVTWYCDQVPFTYVTDAQGGIYIDKNALTSGSHKLSVDLYDEEGVPLVLRLEPDFKIDVPVGIGDSPALYALASLALISLTIAAITAFSLKKKPISND